MKAFATALSLAASGVLPTLAQTATSSSPFTLYTLTADNITATFIPYGARLTSLLVPDRDGTRQDVIAGYDDPQKYLTDTETNHTYFGPVVGRFANRIKNSTFSLNGQTYHIPANEHGGADTLHGGTVGYDQRNWTVTAKTADSITFTLLDDAFEGFPGTLLTHETFTVSSMRSGPYDRVYPRLTSRIVATPLDKATPIMMANHIYWNLNAFREQSILNDTTFWMPYSDRYIQTDGILIPNGTFGAVASRPGLDFTTPTLFGKNVPQAVDACGTGCTGLDNAFIIDRPRYAGPESSDFPVLSMWSSSTGIRMDLSTNQQGLQVYSCDGQNGTIPVRQSQKQRNANSAPNGGAQYVNKYGCVVIETQGYIDSVNHPEWDKSDYFVYSPSTGPYVNYATYDFSTF
ncbi:MAG: hypothetical protein Q9227_002152 [Pyrenula ochraceoflavens]